MNKIKQNNFSHFYVTQMNSSNFNEKYLGFECWPLLG